MICVRMMDNDMCTSDEWHEYQYLTMTCVPIIIMDNDMCTNDG